MPWRNRPHSEGTTPRVVSCDIGGFSVVLRSDLAQVADDFAALYPDHTSCKGAGHRTIQLEVRRAGRSRMGRRLYRVLADGQEVGGWRRANGVFPLLEWGINLRVMASWPEYLQLHAASLAYRGVGVIFAGDSGCGKSTLSTILLARGWKYLCDEFALVNRQTYCLHPFPKAVCIKQGSYDIVRALGLPIARRRDYIKEYKGRVSYIDPRDIGVWATDPTPVPVRYVVFPRYRPGQRPHLQPVCRSHATMRLLRSCFNRQDFPDAALGMLTAVVGRSECFQLDSGPPEETGRLLEGLIESSVESSSTSAAQSPDTGTAAPRRLVGERNERLLRSRRDLLRIGAKVAYVTPTVLMFSATPALAAGSNPSGICSTGLNTGELCGTDSDCCSKDCDFGICQ